MARPEKILIGIDEFVERQVWWSFDCDWPELAPELNGLFSGALRAIGESYLTAAQQPVITSGQQDAALDWIVRLIDRIGLDASRGKLGVAYGLSHNLPSGADWRFFHQMGQAEPRLEAGYRYDGQLRACTVEADAGRSQGPSARALEKYQRGRHHRPACHAVGGSPGEEAYLFVCPQAEESRPCEIAVRGLRPRGLQGLGRKTNRDGIATSIKRVLSGQGRPTKRSTIHAN